MTAYRMVALTGTNRIGLGLERLTDYDATPTFGSFGREYFQVMFGDRAHDHSFAILRGDEPVAAVDCTVQDGVVGFFNRPVAISLAWGRDDATIVRRVFERLDAIAVETGASKMRLADPQPGARLSEVGLAALARKAQMTASLSIEADLTLPEERLYADVRKSFKSLINWGRRNLRLAYVNRDTPDPVAFQAFRDLHAAAAGRVTRADGTWECMFAALCRGDGELVLGYDSQSGALLSGTLVLDGRSTAEYASAAYDRDRFDLPLAHWVVWHSLLRARARGMSRFVLGDIPGEEASEKEAQIAYFKKGFSSRVVLGMNWTWPTHRNNPS